MKKLTLEEMEKQIKDAKVIESKLRLHKTLMNRYINDGMDESKASKKAYNEIIEWNGN